MPGKTESRPTDIHERLVALVADLKARDVRKLPTEPELVDLLKVGRHSIRLAVERMVESGELERQQGRGTFIRDRVETTIFSGWIGTEPPGDEAIRRITASFEQDVPGSRVLYRPAPYYDFLEIFIKDAVHGMAPEIIQVTPPMLASLNQLGLIQPLGQLANHNNLRRAYPEDVQSGEIDGQMLAVTWGLSPLLLYCNTQVLKRSGLDPDQAPSTMTELLQMAAEVNRAGHGEYFGISLPLAPTDPVYQWLYPYLLAFGGSFTDDIGNVDLFSDENMEGIDYLKSLYAEGAIKGARKIHEGRILFASDRIAFWVDGPWLRGLLRQLSPLGAEFANHYFIASMPAGADGASHSVLWNHSLALSSQCEDPQRAYRVIEYMTSDARALRHYYDSLGMIPALQDLLQQAPYRSDPVVGVVRRQMEHARRFPIDHRLFVRSVPFVSQALSEIIVKGRDSRDRMNRLTDVMTTLANAAFLGFFLH